MNYELFAFVNGWAGRSSGLDAVARFTASTAIYLLFATAALICVHAARQRRHRQLTLVGATLAIAFVAATAVSGLSHELRPFQTHHVQQLIPHEPGVSMPSDHATAAFTIAAAISVFLYRMWAVPLTIVAVAIGAARVYAGVHYPSDIAVAALIAAAATAAVATTDHLYRRRAGALTQTTAGAAR
ncbi:hypothetical protein Cs7R123_07450 [Catellatospora sp. TT07R-123]|uniref:phosphatase PAP2 family protein n=1 Tax=Catellatospora sp. TT07R-123 TaxID=2733863 RepID=UPI001B04F42D|nr:phosphatase PAP2 family protein [Catellatospora sp. TT07R-123]GHJ43403.1 hypothetical protein Cs7R123_07450 [Catellatospora sp. TT07R-123]